jgi:hypothetical protein
MESVLMTDEQLVDEQEEAMSFLDPLLVLFHEGWHASQAKYRSYDPEHTVEHDDSTAASCVRCHMWAYVRRQIDGRPGVTLLNVRGLKLLNFFDRYVLRFKQVNKAGLHTNFPTEQQNDFDQDVDLPDLPPAAIRLTSGYQLTAGGDAIERVVVARILGRSVLWLSQVNVVQAEAEWTDITPARLAGMSRVDARFRRAGRA